MKVAFPNPFLFLAQDYQTVFYAAEGLKDGSNVVVGAGDTLGAGDIEGPGEG